MHFLWGVFFVGGEDGRHNNWSSSDPTRRRNPVPFANDGVLSRQKSPVTYDSTLSKDVTVRVLIYGYYLCCDVIIFLAESLKTMVSLRINFQIS